MVICDRYLDKKPVILNRLAAHIALAHQQGSLKWVIVQTRLGQEKQKQAIKQLKAKFLDVSIKFQMDYHTGHDRFIELILTDEKKARVIIGMGLDFIEPSGTVRQTFLIFQDPYAI